MQEEAPDAVPLHDQLISFCGPEIKQFLGKQEQREKRPRLVLRLLPLFREITRLRQAIRSMAVNVSGTLGIRETHEGTTANQGLVPEEREVPCPMIKRIFRTFGRRREIGPRLERSAVVLIVACPTNIMG